MGYPEDWFDYSFSDAVARILDGAAEISRPVSIDRFVAFVLPEGTFFVSPNGVGGEIVYFRETGLSGEEFDNAILTTGKSISLERQNDFFTMIGHPNFARIPMFKIYPVEGREPLPSSYFSEHLASYESRYHPIHQEMMVVFGIWYRQWVISQITFFDIVSKIREKVLDRAPRILVPACGNGFLNAKLLALFPHAEVHGIDINPEFRKRWGTYNVRRSIGDEPIPIELRHMTIGNVLDLPYEDGYFDAVLAAGIGTIQTMFPDEVPRMLSEFRRVLGPCRDDFQLDKLLVWSGLTGINLAPQYSLGPQTLLRDWSVLQFSGGRSAGRWANMVVATPLG